MTTVIVVCGAYPVPLSVIVSPGATSVPLELSTCPALGGTSAGMVKAVGVAVVVDDHAESRPYVPRACTAMLYAVPAVSPVIRQPVSAGSASHPIVSPCAVAVAWNF